MDDTLEAQLKEIEQKIADWLKQREAALDNLREVDKFDSATVYSPDIINAAAHAYNSDRELFNQFRRDIKNYGDKHKAEKVFVPEWFKTVREKADYITDLINNLYAKETKIKADIGTRVFFAAHDCLKNIRCPEDYSLSKDGVFKISGRNLIPVCRRPVIVTERVIERDGDETHKLKLSYFSEDKWRDIPITQKSILFNRNKLVDLADKGLPVTSQNANLIVDYLEALFYDSETSLPKSFTVPRCGWYDFNNGVDTFIDPRREAFIREDDKQYRVNVDNKSTFAKTLSHSGSLLDWFTGAYDLITNSPVARFTIGAAVATPLLKILNERNFLMHIYTKTTAGKTTALQLAASAIGSDKMIRSFDATRNGLLGAAADVNDYPFLVDEKQVADGRLRDAMDNLTYALTNGLGRTKLNKDSTLRKMFDWRTIAITTGETQLFDERTTAGAYTRLLSIAAPDTILDADTCRKIRKCIANNYGHLQPLIIDTIYALGADVIRDLYEQLVDAMLNQNSGLLAEHCRYLAIGTFGDALIYLIRHNLSCDEKNFRAALQQAFQSLTLKIAEMIPSQNEVSDFERGKNYLSELIAEHQNEFIGGETPINKMRAVVGKFDKDYTYVTVKFIRDACDRENINYQKLITDLVSGGFITPSDNIKKGYRAPLATVQKKIGKANTRCIRISTTAFDTSVIEPPPECD